MNQPEEMSEQQRGECGVCADWLSGAGLLSQAAMVFSLGVMIAFATGATACQTSFSFPMLGVLFALMLAERYAAIRVVFDARLFMRLANGDLRGLPALDNVLAGTVSVPDKKLARDLSARKRGADRLYRLQAAATLLLLGLNGVAWWLACTGCV